MKSIQALEQELLEGFGEHSATIRDFLAQSASANGAPLNDLNAAVLSVLQEKGFGTRLRIRFE